MRAGKRSLARPAEGRRRKEETKGKRIKKREKERKNEKEKKKERKKRKRRGKWEKEKRKELGKILEKFRGNSREIWGKGEKGFCGVFRFWASV
jgi:hypothetical protein